MVEEQAKSYPYETGGILLGYISKAEMDIVVVKVVGPGPNAINGLNSFLPDGEYHQEQIENEYFASDRNHTYLGDWHIHANGGSKLSSIDKKTLRKISKEPESRAPNPVMVILFGPNKGELTSWQWVPRIIGKMQFGWHARQMNLVFYD